MTIAGPGSHGSPTGSASTSKRDDSGIVTCSALKRSYRDVLRGDGVVFVYLHGTREQIAARLAARHGHYMPAALLDSQFATLEPPGEDEHAWWIDIGPAPGVQADEIQRRLATAGGATS